MIEIFSARSIFVFQLCHYKITNTTHRVIHRTYINHFELKNIELVVEILYERYQYMNLNNLKYLQTKLCLT